MRSARLMLIRHLLPGITAVDDHEPLRYQDQDLHSDATRESHGPARKPSAEKFRRWAGNLALICYSQSSQYHSTASVLAIATAWNSRSTVIIGRKFSATHFWRDVRATNANVIQYVGEGRQAAICVRSPSLLRAGKNEAGY